MLVSQDKSHITATLRNLHIKSQRARLVALLENLVCHKGVHLLLHIKSVRYRATVKIKPFIGGNTARRLRFLLQEDGTFLCAVSYDEVHGESHRQKLQSSCLVPAPISSHEQFMQQGFVSSQTQKKDLNLDFPQCHWERCHHHYWKRKYWNESF